MLAIRILQLIFLQLARDCISKQIISSIKIYLTPKYSYTYAAETS